MSVSKTNPARLKAERLPIGHGRDDLSLHFVAAMNISSEENHS
jgi:hypothetical protein